MQCTFYDYPFRSTGSCTRTTTGFRWVVTFIDDCTKVTWVYVLKYKNDNLFIFK